MLPAVLVGSTILNSRCNPSSADFRQDLPLWEGLDRLISNGSKITTALGWLRKCSKFPPHRSTQRQGNKRSAPLNNIQNLKQSAHGNTAGISKRIQPEILRRKKTFSRRNTLCISRGNDAFPAQKIGCSPPLHPCGFAIKKAPTQGTATLAPFLTDQHLSGENSYRSGKKERRKPEMET